MVDRFDVPALSVLLFLYNYRDHRDEETAFTTRTPRSGGRKVETCMLLKKNVLLNK